MSSYKYAIEVHNVKKRFSYSRHKNNSLKRAITQAFKKKDKTKSTFYALNGISFNVEKVISLAFSVATVPARVRYSRLFRRSTSQLVGM